MTPPSARPSLLLLPLTACLSGCFLFGSGSGSGSRLPVEAIDSATLYARHLRKHPEDESALRYRERLAQLEFVEARRRLRPVFTPGAMFASGPGDSPSALLGESTQMIFDSQEGDWLGFQVVEVAPDPSLPIAVFEREGKPLSLRPYQDAGQRYFNITGSADLALVRTSSFDLQIRQLATVGGAQAGGMRLCFFSQQPGSCEDGYEFSYDSAHFQSYALVRRSGGQSSLLCGYQMDTTNTAHSDRITVNPSTRSLRNPQLDISAHNGHLVVVFNGHQLCHVNDRAYTRGGFLLADTPAITQFNLRLNLGSDPIYATADVLADVPQAGELLSLRDHPLYEDYDLFAADYNAYLAVLGGGDFPESFHHSYFDTFFGSAEAKEAYLAIQGSTKIQDYVSYLEAYPRNPYRREIEKILYQLAKQTNRSEAYQLFLDHYPQSLARLDVRRKMAVLQWTQIVKKPTKRYLDKYLSRYPQGYYVRRAQLLLEGLEYRSQHKAEINEARSVISKAQKLVDRSPVTAAWDVEIVDYQAGSIYYNLNSGPHTPKKAMHVKEMRETFEAQKYAYLSTCTILKKELPSINFCLFTWSMDKPVSARPMRIGEAVIDALESFYLSRARRGESTDMVRVLELLERMDQAKSARHYDEAKYMVQAYTQLGMLDQAAYTVYLHALANKKPGHAKSFAKRALELSPSLAQNSDFQWVIEHLIND